MASDSSSLNKFTANDIRRIMGSTRNVRNVTVIGHVDHGKTTVVKSLVVNSGNENCNKSGCENGSFIAAESLSYSLCFKLPMAFFQNSEVNRDGNDYLINVIDTPGHLDLSFEVTTSLRVTDGTLIVVDCIEGVLMHTERLLHEALREGICPVLTLSKIDRCFLELNLNGEEAYTRFLCSIQKINSIIASYPGVSELDTQIGNVSFSAGLHGWGFTLKSFAKMLSPIFGWEESETLNRLWGENYYDPKTMTWTDYNTGTSTCKRGFVILCYDLIKRIITNCIVDKDKLWPRLEKIGLSLTQEQKELTGTKLVECVMQIWLPSTSAILEIVVFHLPSPCIGQFNRVNKLYRGPPGDRFSIAIRDCDPGGPLILYVSRLLLDEKGGFFAFGRVYSGKVSRGMKVRVIGVEDVQGRNDLPEECVKDIVVLFGNMRVSLPDVPSGSIVALFGMQKRINKAATLVNAGENDVFAIRPMSFGIAPLVHVLLKCSESEQYHNLDKGLGMLNKYDPLVVVLKKNEDGERIIHVSGELHLRLCIKLLEPYLQNGAKILIRVPIVSYCETVLGLSNQPVTCFSANGNSRVTMEARPLELGLTQRIVAGLPLENPQLRTSILCDDFQWDKEHAKRILSFAPDHIGPNILVDLSKDGVGSSAIKNLIIDAFMDVTEKGALAGQRMRGICYEIQDASVEDKGMNVFKLVKEALIASQLAAEPRLVELAYEIRIVVHLEHADGVYRVLNVRRGKVLERLLIEGIIPMLNITASLPVSSYLGFSDDLRISTIGQASAHIIARNWKMIEADPLKVGSEAANIVAAINKRKEEKYQ